MNDETQNEKDSMPLVEARTYEPVVVQDNVYKAQVVAWRKVETQYGKALAIDFRILSEGEHAGKILGGLCNRKELSKKTKLYKWATILGATLPQEIGDPEFQFNDLINKECRILTATKSKSGPAGEYFDSFVKEIMPIE